jgi:hypothetical protein
MQEWWQRKFETYSSILEALWHLRASSQETIEDFERMESSGAAAPQRIPHDWLKHSTRLRQVTETGAFVVSPRALKVLQDYTKSEARIFAEYEDSEDEYGAATANLDAVIKCIEETRQAAMDDLRISNSVAVQTS